MHADKKSKEHFSKQPEKCCYFKLRCSSNVTASMRNSHSGLKKSTSLVAFINARPVLSSSCMVLIFFLISYPTYPSNSFKYAQRVKSHFQSFVLSTNNSQLLCCNITSSFIQENIANKMMRIRNFKNKFLGFYEKM